MASGGRSLKRIALRGDEIRKKGLWKDITNKALGGVPGLQKEGTDGVITSAEFVLYPQYEAERTICLEFFGPDMDEASRVILELSKAFPFPDSGAETLMALEHFDDEYVRAIDYKVKASRAETPKAVLLIDVAGHTDAEAARGVERVRTVLEHHPNTLLFEARDAAEARRFWADRKKLGAIARRTNAFKLNEDIVIPLEALAEFARFIDATERGGGASRPASLRGARGGGSSAQLAASTASNWTSKLAAAVERCARARSAMEQAGRRDHLARPSSWTALRHELSELRAGLSRDPGGAGAGPPAGP